MNTPSLDGYADDFERLAALSPAQREAALAALPMSATERAVLRNLLDADAGTGDPLVDALGAGAAQMAAQDRQRLGAYQLLHELGAGGMGTVFLAERVDGGFVQTVAIKLLRGFPTADGLRRLRQERQILAGLDHPHIARLLDGGETDDGQPWLVLEYVDGLPLLEYAARHAPRLHDRLKLFDAMLDAIGYAHQRLVIHRDIKPANVLVNATGEVKLLDFGIARLVDLESGSAARETSTRVFSAGYASPEQREGRAVTTASDIYSLGRLLRELVASASGPAQADLPLDAELAGIVAKATDEDPVRRYASAGEFRDDLDRYRDGRPVRAARLTRAYRLRKFLGRHRLGVAASLAVIVALGLFVWRLDHERNRAVAAEMTAERDARRARAALEFLTDAFEAAAPDNALGQTVSVRELLDGARERLALRRLDASIAKPLQRLLGGLYAELGDTTTGAELLALGTSDAMASDRADALALARDHDRLAELEATNGHHEAALAVIARAEALRARHAPGNVDEAARNLLALAQVHHHRGDYSKTVSLLRQALESVPGKPPLDAGLERNISNVLTTMLVFSGECREALERSEAPSAVAADEAPSPTERIQALRTLGLAHLNCGGGKRAESLFRAAIAEQETLTGPGGYRMSVLVQDLGLALSQQNRYREAVETMERADALDPVGSERPRDRAITLNNLATTYERAGDYERALALFRRADEEMGRAELPADAQERRVVLRSQARTLALTGEAERGATMLAELREQARRLDGAGSFEHVICTLQLVLAERLSGRLETAETYLREAEAGLAGILPESHVAFAQAMLLHGTLAMQRGEPAKAVQEFQRAITRLQDSDAALIDVAKARADLVDAYFALGRHAEARAQLAQILPQLRDQLLPSQVHRVRAERVATALGLP